MKKIYCFGIIILFNLFVGAVSINFISNNIFSKDLPWWADTLIGLFAAQLSVPIAIIGWILKICGVDIHIV